MRILLLILVSFTFITLKAQTVLPLSGTNFEQANFMHNNAILGDSSNLHKKWFVTPYAGISTGIIFSGAGSGSFLTAPLGLQLNRRLNNNLYAFGAATIAPAYFNFNRPVAGVNNNYHTFNGNSFGMQSSISAGLMYVNDAKTFSISGSIGISRNDYPFYQPTRANAKQPLLTGSRQ